MKYAAAALLLSLAPAFAADDDTQVREAVTALEKQSWVAWQGHDAAFFGRFLSDDHLDIFGNGILNKTQVVAGVAAGCTVKSYEAGEMRFTRVAADSALLVYRASQDTHCGAVVVPSPVLTTSLYVKRDGRWQNLLYEQNILKP